VTTVAAVCRETRTLIGVGLAVFAFDVKLGQVVFAQKLGQSLNERHILIVSVVGHVPRLILPGRARACVPVMVCALYRKVRVGKSAALPSGPGPEPRIGTGWSHMPFFRQVSPVRHVGPARLFAIIYHLIKN
jgi:hypothetical protein